MLVGVALCCIYYVFFSSRRRHTRCALVTGVQSCALPISGVVHTLRAIPEACARLQGEFTRDAAQPDRFAAVRTSANCQPRARLVYAAKARPSVQAGWIFNDVIRVPNAACATQQAVVRVWRRAADVAPPKLDDQGRSRIYLKESLAKAKAGQLAPIPVYAASMQAAGLHCQGSSAERRVGKECGRTCILRG